MRLELGTRAIGDGAPCFVAAEVGINHNGDLALAHRLIDEAAAAGADGVKFQSYRTEDFISDRSLEYEYVSEGRPVREPQFDMFKRYELPVAALAELRAHCDERGVVFFATPTSERGIDELAAAGAPLLKNGSDYLGHLPLVRAMGRSGIPTVLSTGMATLADVDEAVRAFRDAGGRELVLLHCTSSYPTPPGEVNLRAIPVLATAFGCPVGFSDHTDGVVAAIGAVASGACFVEKHFTLDRTLPGPDHRFSSDPAELTALVSAIREVEAELGSGEVGPTASEERGRDEFRLSCAAAAALPVGHELTGDDIVYRRPGSGLPPAAVSLLVGRRLARAVAAGAAIVPADLA
jgi:N-acetylneuraminate synthase/N,N'-diacetyllegionaminate synthase